MCNIVALFTQREEHIVQSISTSIMYIIMLQPKLSTMQRMRTEAAMLSGTSTYIIFDVDSHTVEIKDMSMITFIAKGAMHNSGTKLVFLKAGGAYRLISKSKVPGSTGVYCIEVPGEIDSDKMCSTLTEFVQQNADFVSRYDTVSFFPSKKT